MATAESMSFAFRSAILVSAIPRSCSCVTLPTAPPRPGVCDPFSSPAARFRRKPAGGVLVTKLKDRSAYTVITVGIGMPASRFCVEALNALQNSMMLTPRCPSAGPIGGDGLAWPAGTCSLM